MELRELRCFCAVAEELHFGNAAKQLGMSQPALSMQIRRLETSLGVRLLSRTTRNVGLTAAGAAFLEEARLTLAGADRAALVAVQAQRGESGDLDIAFAPDTVYDLIPPAVRGYVRRFPSVRLGLHELWTSEQVGLVRDGHIDLGIIRPPIDERDVSIQRLRGDRMLVALPLRHAFAHRRRLWLRELNGQSWLRLPAQPRPQQPDRALALLEGAGVRPQFVAEASQIPTLLGLVAAGIGVCVLPSAVRREKVRGVAYVDIADEAASSEIAAIWSSRGRQPKTVQAFLEILAEISQSARVQ